MSDHSPELFVIDVSRPSEGVFLVGLAGEMDIANAAEFSARVTGLGISDAECMVIDLSELTFLDSTGINALVSAAKSIEAGGGTVTLAAPTPHIRQVFEIVHLSDVLAIEASLEAALSRAKHNGRGGDDSQEG